MRKLSHLFWFFLHWIYFLIPDCNSTQIIKLLKWRSEVKSLSRVQPFATPRTVAYKAPLSVEFSRQEYWSGLSFPSPGDLPDPGIEPGSPALQADSLPTELWRKPMYLKMHESVSLRVLSKALWAVQLGKNTAWVASSFSRGSFQPRNRTQVSCIAGRFFTNWAMKEAHVLTNAWKCKSQSFK